MKADDVEPAINLYQRCHEDVGYELMNVVGGGGDAENLTMIFVGARDYYKAGQVFEKVGALDAAANAFELAEAYDVAAELHGKAGQRRQGGGNAREWRFLRARGHLFLLNRAAGSTRAGGDIPGPQVFGETDRIMAFDVVLPLDTAVADVSPTGINFGPVVPTPTRTRNVALFEGMDEYGRLQPLLGTAEPATD